MRLRPLSAFSQEETINQEFGKIQSTLPCSFSSRVSGLSRSFWLPSRTPCPFPASKWKQPFSGVGGLRKDQMEEKGDEKWRK